MASIGEDFVYGLGHEDEIADALAQFNLVMPEDSDLSAHYLMPDQVPTTEEPMFISAEPRVQKAAKWAAHKIGSNLLHP